MHIPQARLPEAVALAAGDVDMRARAAALGAKIKAEDGIGRAVEAIEARLQPT